jgi:predicted AAA+ superfamily ATPase
LKIILIAGNQVPRKPLIIRGARQVGKTTLIRDFAETYTHAIVLDLEKPADRRYLTILMMSKPFLKLCF